MPLSGLPSGGPTLPSGAQKVSLKDIDTDNASSNKEDVTVLGDTEREYADPPLKDGGSSAGATATCSASGLLTGSAPSVSPLSVTTGWVCEDAEVTYETGKYATWSANWSYYPT